MSTIFTARRYDDDSFEALILTVNNDTGRPSIMASFVSLKDLKESVREQYGQAATYVSPQEFQRMMEEHVTAQCEVCGQRYSIPSDVFGEKKPASTIFTARRDGAYLVAVVLEAGASTPIDYIAGGFKDIMDLQARVKAHYGQDATYLSPSKFKSAMEMRQIHSPEILALLHQEGDLLGLDLSSYVVYGSSYRPMSRIWARIDNAVFMQVDKQQTSYHTYVAVPELLTKEIIERYELSFVSRPEDLL